MKAGRAGLRGRSPRGTCIAVADPNCSVPPAPARLRITRLASHGFIIARSIGLIALVSPPRRKRR
jgi:hypothetical protein